MVAAVSNSAVEILRPSQSADARAVRNINAAESAHAYLFVPSPNHSISLPVRPVSESLDFLPPAEERLQLAGAVDEAEYIHPVFQRPVENEHPFKPCDAEHA